MSGTTEAFARVKIDAPLKNAGWSLTDGSSVPFEHALQDGMQADYVLCDRQERLMASLEAKRACTDPITARGQGRQYAKRLGVPFVLGSNSKEVRFLHSAPAKARYKRLSPRHCGYCVPCLIRRASLKAGLGVTDPTPYTVENLYTKTLASDRVEGKHVRSFQLMAQRIQTAPSLANILVHKPGPLVDVPDEIPDYADVFRRGVLEVGKLLQGVKAKPGG